MKKSNLTYEQLIELAPKDRPFQIEVEMSSGISYGKQKYWIMFYEDENNEELLLNNPNFEPYFWKHHYTGKFTLIDEYRNMYEKPEVLEVGTKVEILESVRECEDYEEFGKIESVYDNSSGVSYKVKFVEYSYLFPHYCVRSVGKLEEKEDNIPEFENTINQLDNLFTQAQDIINKYKK